MWHKDRGLEKMVKRFEPEYIVLAIHGWQKVSSLANGKVSEVRPDAEGPERA